MSIDRDKDGRPLIIPSGGTSPIPYHRASNLGSVLDDRTNLHRWQARKAAMGLAIDAGLLQEVRGLLDEVPDPAQQYPQKAILDRVVADAMKAGRANEAAEAGSRLHDLTERIDRGERVDEDRPTMERLEEYLHTRHGVEVVAAEQFVANDALTTAGTFDRLLRLPGGRMVMADIKTGRHDARYPLGVCVQTSVYATGEWYDPATGDRTPLPSDLDPTVGLLIHMPQLNRRGVHLYWLNLNKGLEAARAAVQVHRVRGWTADELRRPVWSGAKSTG